MKFIELTKYQSDQRRQSTRVTINTDHIVHISEFEYSTGTMASVIEFPGKTTIEVTESYDDILNMLRSRMK
jgi:hypothetical protein